SFSHLQRRAATSLPPPSSQSQTLNPSSSSPALPSLRRDAHSASPNPASAVQFSRSSSVSDADDSMASDDGEEEYSDVDFWGGESPRLLSRSPPRVPGDEMAIDDVVEESEDEDDDEDTDMLDDDDEEGEDESDGLDRMEIFGHR
ncbi:MAG: hypothetical protein Q9164_007857, partial [Protoblastenia rupestris]